MGKIIETKINTFNGGMVTDPRDTSVGVARVIKNFYNDDKHRLLPFRSMEVDAVTESSLDNYGITQFLNTGANIYGLGRVSTSDQHVQIYEKTSAGDPTSVWTTSTTATSASGGARDETLFIYYKNQDCIYGANSTGIWKWNTTTHTFTYNDYTTYIPSGVQGIVHSKDDILYVPVGYRILKNNAGTWSVGLTLPVDCTAVSICEKENYLTIACNRTNGTSIVYLWDRDSSLTTISESINWGTGTIKWIENLGGTLVTGGTIGASATVIAPRFLISYWNGSSVVPLYNFEATLTTVLPSVQKFDNKIYFLADLTLNGVAHKGLWRVQKNSNGAVTFAFDRYARNDTAIDAATLKGFYRIGDYMFISYLNPTGLGYTVWRTNNDGLYSATSIYETPIINQGDSSITKKLMGVTLVTEPLPTAGSVSLYYRKDGATAWTLIFTNTTDSSISHDAINIESSSDGIGEHKELEFHVESTGGAVITGLSWKEEIIDKKPY